MSRVEHSERYATHRVECSDAVSPHKCFDLLVRDLVRVSISRPEIRRRILFVRFQVKDTLHALGTSQSEDKSDSTDYSIEVVF